MIWPKDTIISGNIGSFRQAAKSWGWKDYVQLKYPEKGSEVAIPVEMDDSSIQF